MSDLDWQDPFADGDESARERARRRAEREARRRGSAPPEGAEAPPPSESHPTESHLEDEEWDPEPSLEEDVPNEPPRDHRGRVGGQPPSHVVLRRRVMAFGLLILAFAVAAFGIATVADRFGGTGDAEEEPPVEVEETISVTIPEGLDRRQIAAITREAELRGNYARASRQAQGFNPGRFGADDPDTLEGFLFPATYELRPNAHVRALIERQLEAFRERIREVNMRHAESRNLTVYDVLKIASMIEREVQIPRERKLVSAVIYNRLADGSPLGIDATIRYEDGNFDEPLTESRLADPTPYNTRVHAGLPPSPIGNPGLAAVRAAANPADVDHFYYVVKPYTCGEHVFTASEEEFQQAVAEYQRALAEEGGAPTPDDC